MITVHIPRPVYALRGGTPEEWKLHAAALEQHLQMRVQMQNEAEASFYVALASMNAANAKIAESAYAGADSMWGL